MDYNTEMNSFYYSIWDILWNLPFNVGVVEIVNNPYTDDHHVLTSD